MCSVKILKEAVLGDILSDVRPSSHCKFCCDPPERGTANKTAVDRQGNILTSVTMSTSPQVLMSVVEKLSEDSNSFILIFLHWGLGGIWSQVCLDCCELDYFKAAEKLSEDCNSFILIFLHWGGGGVIWSQICFDCFEID